MMFPKKPTILGLPDLNSRITQEPFVVVIIMVKNQRDGGLNSLWIFEAPRTPNVCFFLSLALSQLFCSFFPFASVCVLSLSAWSFW